VVVVVVVVVVVTGAVEGVQIIVADDWRRGEKARRLVLW